MLKKSLLFAFIGLVVLAWGCETSSKAGRSVEKLETHLDSVSYAIGMDIGKNFKTQGIELDLDVFLKGMQDGTAAEGVTMLNEEQSRALLMAFQRELQAKQEDKRRAEGAENLAKATEFLAQNRGKAGITELPSGLQYEVLKEGDGPSPTIDDQVTTHYHGTLIDGTVFDSSVERGQPATFPLNGVIRAWQEILPMMKTGAKYRIYSPPALAYGEFGSPPKIGANEALVFEIELISIAGK